MDHPRPAAYPRLALARRAAQLGGAHHAQPLAAGTRLLPIAIVFLTLVSLPLDIYSQHIERAYGLSVQSWPSWSLDQLKALGLSIVVMTPLLFLLFWVIRVAPRKWWLWFWLCTLPVIVFAVFVSPIWIDPIFNHFSPLQKSDPALTLQLEQLAHHAGLDIPPSRMFLMKASEKVTGLNAYVTGIGATTRIVVWDNTIHKLPPIRFSSSSAMRWATTFCTTSTKASPSPWRC